MDYPKSVPNVGLVGGQFVDENASTGQVGSLIPSSWGNSVTQEILNVIKAAGLAPSEVDLSQLLKAVQVIAASDIKRTVQCATTGPIALSGLQTIDGVALTAGKRVLVKDQASAAQNWIYTVAAGAWVRALDANESTECTPGHLIIVESGTASAGSVWQLSNTVAPVLGTTALNFVRVLGKTGVAAGTYRQVDVDSMGRVTGGANPTSLAGFGILDALKIGQVGLAATSGPLLTDFKALTPTGFYQAYGATVPDIATLNGPEGSQGNVMGVIAVTPRADATYYLAFENAGSSILRRIWLGQYNKSAGGTETIFWSAIITDDKEANGSEAEAGTVTGKWMSPLRVFQAIAKKVVQATESVLGVAKVATQAQINAGADDTCMVTPKKLRWGVSYLIAANGYVAVPSWLGGFILQWGTATVTTTVQGGSATVSLPYSYPNNHFGAVGSYKKSSVISDSFPAYAYPTSLSTVTLTLDAATGGSTPTGAQEAFYFSLGN